MITDLSGELLCYESLQQESKADLTTYFSLLYNPHFFTRLFIQDTPKLSAFNNLSKTPGAKSLGKQVIFSIITGFILVKKVLKDPRAQSFRLKSCSSSTSVAVNTGRF